MLQRGPHHGHRIDNAGRGHVGCGRKVGRRFGAGSEDLGLLGRRDQERDRPFGVARGGPMAGDHPDSRRRRRRLDPVGDPRMQGSTVGREEAPIGGILDQRVAEPPAAVRVERDDHGCLGQPLVDRVLDPFRENAFDRGFPEVHAEDGPDSKDGARVGR